MNKAINRTTIQVDDNTFRMYPKSAPLFCKDEDGKWADIDLTFEDAESNIGEISLLNKGVVSVGKRKGNNPHKVVGIRPDIYRNGYKQLEFSLVNVELDNEKQEFNVEEDLELQVRLSKVNQLIKLNKKFSECKIEFDVHLKNMEIMNDKYKDDSNLCDFGFNLTNIGENNGSTTLGMYNSYNGENREIPYLDCYVGKINDDYITTGEYSIEEEFGEDDLSGYTLERMYENGGSAYLKDCIVFAVKPSNIDNFEEIIVNQICDLYGLETIWEENKNGQYFTKDGKKVASYYSNNNTFLSFFNTTEIPDSVKALFKRKTFKDTSYLDISVEELCEDIESRLGKDLTIKVDSNYYEPINDNFIIRINKESYYIGNPIAFDEDKNILPYKTTHTLKDNEDGTFRYTKYLLPETALNINDARYLDATLSVGTPAEGTVYYTFPSSTGIKKTYGNLQYVRNNTAGTGILTASADTDKAMEYCGDNTTKSSQSTQQGTITNYLWGTRQTHIFFDTSGISDTVTDADLKMYGGWYTSGTVGSPYNADISIILLKSTASGTHSTAWHNDITGHTTSWNASDVTEYSAEHVVSTYQASALLEAIPGSYNLEAIELNADCLSDLQSQSTTAFCFMDYDTIYSNSVTSYGVTASASRRFVGAQQDHSVVANRPYIEYTTATVTTPTDNANFFGTHF